MKRTTAIFTAALFLFLATAGGALAQQTQNQNQTQNQVQNQMQNQVQNQLRIKAQNKTSTQTRYQEPAVQELDDVLSPEGE
ncbi:MAG TPA: hypothetical protein ENN06_10055 [Desulfobacteraceae bacterium]|nr:hypothetical protein [Desulfobacteraceae bacterium]